MRFHYYLIISIVPCAAVAHHGPGQFDRSQPVEVTGAVTEVRFEPYACVELKDAFLDGPVG